MHLAQHQSLAGGSMSNHMRNRAPGRGAESGSRSPLKKMPSRADRSAQQRGSYLRGIPAPEEVEVR